MRGVTITQSDNKQVREFLLTRLMRGVTVVGVILPTTIQISTHTPHARRDRNI